METGPSIECFRLVGAVQPLAYALDRPPRRRHRQADNRGGEALCARLEGLIDLTGWWAREALTTPAGGFEPGKASNATGGAK